MAGLLTAGLVAVAVAAGFIELRAFPLNHDAAWYLYVAGAWLDGKRLYVDILEVSPPVIVWLSAPAVALARLAGTSVGTTFRGWMFALAFGSLAVGLPALRRLEPDRSGLGPLRGDAHGRATGSASDPDHRSADFGAGPRTRRNRGARAAR